MRRCQLVVPFQGAILTVEELGGINKDFIVFNPSRLSGRPDYKIQMTDRVLLRFEDKVNELISISDYPDGFVIVNSIGDELADSENMNPTFVESIMIDIIETGGKGIARKDLN